MTVHSQPVKDIDLAIAEAAVQKMIDDFHLPGEHAMRNFEKVQGIHNIPCIEAHKHRDGKVRLNITVGKSKYHCILKSSVLSSGDLFMRIISLMRGGHYWLEPWLTEYKKQLREMSQPPVPLYRQLELAREILKEYDQAIKRWQPYLAYRASETQAV